ncbi:MAG: CpXC domain-containing protein [Candidatus Cryptobacteroides sp.]
MICEKCACEFQASVPSSVNPELQPELKEKVLDGTLFLSRCPKCGATQLYNGHFLYHDPSLHLLLVLSKDSLLSNSLEGYTCRRVESVGELIEKIKIFETGLDDIAVELCKFVTLQELGKQVELKFFKMDGADADLTFAYPEKGQMQMLELPHNVYSDALSILSRNPQLKEYSAGLAKIDQQWLSHFLK